MDELDPRRQELWQLQDFGSGSGLEIGPLHDPIIRRHDGNVRYVDIVDRDGLRAYYGSHPGVPIDHIPEIDYPLTQPDGRIASLAEAVRHDAPFDWVIASHVVEHVPDVIGWLEDLAEVVADGGVLVLVVPDRRYCFDVQRPPTTIGAMLEAHELRADRPGVRAVYDHYSSAVQYDVEGLWRNEIPPLAARIHSLADAQFQVAESLRGKYVDCHVWLFTPDSFAEQIHELRVTGNSSWYVEHLRQTGENTLEFMVRLRRIDRDQDPRAPIDDEWTTSNAQPEWMLGEIEARQRVCDLEEQVRAVSRECARLQRRLRAKSRRLRVKSQRLRKLRLRLQQQPQPPATEAPSAGVLERFGHAAVRRIMWLRSR